MRNALLSLATLLICLSSYSQEEAYDLSILQGIQQEKFTFIDAEGYSISIYKDKKKYSNKTIKKYKKKFDISKRLEGIIDSSLMVENRVFEQQIEEDDIQLYKKNVIFKSSEKHSSIIDITTSITRDPQFENEIIKAIVRQEIPKSIYNNWKVDSIRFVNRHIQLGDACTWQNVGSIQCPYNGQMDWSVFSDQARAKEYLKQRIQHTSDKNMSDFITQDSVQVIFEGQEVMAQKNVLKIKVPKLILGGSNELTIYYVIAPIDTRYVACVLSHYSNDNNAPNLPPLLSEVMSLKPE